VTALRICFAGDSITNGTGDDACLGWPGRLCAGERARGHDVTYYNLGVRAETSEHIGERWRGECRPRLPEPYPGALVFSFGVNDMAEEAGTIRVPLSRSLENARRIIGEAMRWKPTLWIGPVPVDDASQPFSYPGGPTFYFSGPRMAELSAGYAEIARELGAPYLELMIGLSADEAFLGAVAAGDGVHPTAAGYAIVGARVAAWKSWRAWFDG